MFSTPPASSAARKAIDDAIMAGTRKVLGAHSDVPQHSRPSFHHSKAKTEGSVKTEVPVGAALSVGSNHSEIEFIARKKRLELEAAQASAQIERDLIQKKLAADIAALEVERSEGSRKSARSAQSNVSAVQHKVSEWMQRSDLDAMERPLASGSQHGAPPAAAAPTDIQQLAYALKDAITATAGQLNTHIMPRLGKDRELPLFFGDPMEWLTFKQAYSESTNLCKYTDAENLCRLRNCLRGEAKETVSSLLIGNTSAASIVGTLELRYGRPEVIIQRITSQLRKLAPLPPAYHNDLVNFSIKVKNYVAAAQAIQQTDYLRSPELMTAVMAKCPTALITKWADYAFAHRDTDKPKLEIFSDFLFDEATKISSAGISHVYTYRKPEEKKPLENRHFVLTQTKPDEKRCIFCRGNCRSLPDCTKFKRAMRKDRWSFIRSRHMCHKCLLTRHKREECPASNCNIDQCGLPHHELLHWPNPGASSPTSSSPQSADQVNNVRDNNPSADGDNAQSVNNTISVSHCVAMLKIVPVVLRGPKGAVTTSALLDDGATVSLIARDIADAIGLKGQKKQLCMRGAWDNNEIVCTSETVSCSISNSNCEKLYDFHAYKINELNLPEQKILKVDTAKYKHLHEISEFISYSNCKPKILIGQDNYDLIKPLQLLTGNKNEPFGTLTPLGWCVHGLMSTLSPAYSPGERFHRSAIDAKSCAHISTRVESPPLFSDDSAVARKVSDCDLSELVRKSFALDALGVSAAPPRQNRDEVRAIEILDNTAQLINGRWVVGLPWKSSNTVMPDSYPTAFSRLKSIERKMSRDQGFADRYSERIEHLFSNNYAREIDVTESGPRVWYLPHFGVDNPNKKKLRLVFDSAATTGEFCLNSYLLQGPDLLASLVGIMLRFRENKVGISADIRDMFLRVKIRPEDQHALRFLWRTEGEVKHFAMTSLIFGANCSPFVAQFIKNKNAERFKQTMPDAVEAIVNNHYCDDYIDSFTTTEAAAKSMKEITDIHKQGGFEIRNWTSNDPAVCDLAPKESLSEACVRLNFQEKELSVGTLGLLWYPSTDCLGFNLSFRNVSEQVLNSEQKPTKRELLRIVMSIFDVFGLLAPFTMKAKILLRSTWKQNLTWD